MADVAINECGIAWRQVWEWREDMDWIEFEATLSDGSIVYVFGSSPDGVSGNLSSYKVYLNGITVNYDFRKNRSIRSSLRHFATLAKSDSI